MRPAGAGIFPAPAFVHSAYRGRRTIMPAAITHFLHSQRVLAGIKQAGRETFSPEAFAWGAQGPDFFYCHRFLPWWRGQSLAGWGDRLHDAPPAETLASMWRYVKAHPEDRYARSYAQGFLCHYAADSVCHPFVEYRASLMAKEIRRRRKASAIMKSNRRWI